MGNDEKVLIFKKSGNVSTIYLETATGSMKEVFQNKNHKELAHITVVDKEGNIDTFVSDSAVKGRGNTTWEKEKKPLGILFNEHISILGMKASRKYALLAKHFTVKTRNASVDSLDMTIEVSTKKFLILLRKLYRLKVLSEFHHLLMMGK